MLQVHKENVTWTWKYVIMQFTFIMMSSDRTNRTPLILIPIKCTVIRKILGLWVCSMLYYRYLLLFLALFVGLLCECQAQTDEEKIAEWQVSLPGAHYFWHCKCYGHYMLPDSKPGSDWNRRFPNDTPEHPKKPARGIIHYDSKGRVHVTPSRPDGFRG